MGQDHDARHAAKKKRKRTADSDEQPRRQRSKNKVRRLCRGVCFQPPGLAPQDKEWAPSAGGSASDAEAAVAAPVSLEQQPPAKKRRRQKGKQEGGGLRQSTAVNLLSRKAPGKAAAGREVLQPASPSAEPHRSLTLASFDAAAASNDKAELEQWPETLQQIMKAQGLTHAMPVQARCWPHCLAGRDVEVTAEPGSGKTLAFLLPAAVRLQELGHSADSHPQGPVALVLVPTRELAQQIASVCRAVRKASGLRTVCLVGGVDKASQVEALGKHPHIVVATPGRLLDLVDDEEATLTLGEVQYVVLDEADKMLSQGLQPQLKRIRQLVLPKGRKQQEPHPEGSRDPEGSPEALLRVPARARPQVLLFSATMPQSLAAMTAKWLRQPEVVKLSEADTAISRSVVQVVHVCAEHKKPQKLLKHLASIKEQSAGMRNPPRVLIFANRIKIVRFVHGELQAGGWRAVQLHGERSQEEREAALLDFRSGKAQVLVATDVAARGLHITGGLPYIVNYDFPGNLETYVHRVGRSGRLSTDGHAYSFMTRNLAPLAEPLLKLLQVHGQPVDPNLKLLAESYQLVAQKMSSMEAGQDPDLGAGAQEEGEQAQQTDDDNPDQEADPADDMPQLNGAHADASDSDADVRLSRHKAKKRRSILH